jgi:uncharacterized membrane protein
MNTPPVTRKDSNVRLALYIAAGTLSAASAGAQTVNFTDPKEVFGFAIGVMLAAVTAWRAYIDQTPNQVQP